MTFDYTHLGDLLKEARETVNMKQSEVAELIGCTASNVSSWERAKSKIDIESLVLLCNIYEINFSELMNKVHTKQSSDFTNIEKNIIKKYRTLDRYGKKAIDNLLDNEYDRCQNEKIIEVLQLPMSEFKVSAGTGNWLEDNRYGTIEVVDTPESRKADLVIEVSGNSMEPTYHNGDNLLIRLQPSVNIGEIGVFIKDTEGFIKELGKNCLISHNKNYSDIILNEFTDIRCVGKVIGIAEVIK